jgi:ribosome-associated protein
MNNGLFITPEIIIPDIELEITASRAGGPGGQHVNKTESRITVRWNVQHSHILPEKQKAWVLKNLQHRLTQDGELIVHYSASRSQQHNKKMALINLAHEVRKALHIPKKRIATQASPTAQHARLKRKKHHSIIKKMRQKKFEEN